eukprot:Platyproteum_vivax@DN2401_c0_g1_i1.p1
MAPKIGGKAFAKTEEAIEDDEEIDSDEFSLGEDSDEDDTMQTVTRQAKLIVTNKTPASEKKRTGGKYYDGTVDNHIEPVTIDDVLDALPANTAVSANLTRIKETDLLPLPLGRFAQAKVQRRVHYEEAKKDIRKFNQQFYRNRDAEEVKLGYSLEHPHVELNEITATFEPDDDFEKELADAIENTGLGGSAIFESQTMLAAPEVKENLTARQRAKVKRMLMQEQERFQRVKKIKSRMYRKIQRKTAEREKEKLLKKLDEENPELAQNLRREYEEKLARIRSLAHATARSKWARMAQRFGGSSAQTVVTEQAQRSHDEKKMVERIVKGKNKFGEGDISSSSSEDDEDADDQLDAKTKVTTQAKLKVLKELQQNDAPMPTTGIFNLKFMQNHIERRREEVRSEAQELLDEMDGKEADNEVKHAPKRKKFSKEQLWTAEKQLKKLLSKDEANLERLEVEDSSEKEPFIPAQESYLQEKNIWLKKNQPKTIEGEEYNRDKKSPVEEDALFEAMDKKHSEQQALIRQAFVASTHEKEWLEEVEEAEKTQAGPEEESMAGWGSWTGGGIPTKKRKKSDEQPSLLYPPAGSKAPPAAPPKKFKAVIINQELDRKMSKYFVDKAPALWGSQEQYEGALGHPLGPEWNTEAAHKRMIKPQINLRLGQVITPLQYIKKLGPEVADSLLTVYDTKPLKGRHRRTKTRL